MMITKLAGTGGARLAQARPPAACGAAAAADPAPAAPAAEVELRTTWRGQETVLTRFGWDALRAALPSAESVLLADRDARPHPRTSAVCLVWPPAGALTTGRRRAWSGRPIGTGPNGRTVSPEAVADALRAAAAESGVGEPAEWQCRWTECGDWWLLRALWPGAPDGRAGARPPAGAITVRHDVCSPDLVVQASWLDLASGAEIIGRAAEARVRGRRLRMGPLAGGECIDLMGEVLDTTADLLALWSAEGLSRPTLAAWAGAVAGPRFGADMPRRLLVAHDTSRRRAAAGEPGLRSVRDLAWALARRALEDEDIERRMRLQLAVLPAVSEVPWWNAPNDPDDAPRRGPDPALVH